MSHFIRLCALLGVFVVTGGCGVSSTDAGGQATTPPTQAVTIRFDHPTYRGADAIKVTIQNQFTTPIYAHDTAASCSILQLQQQVNGVWQGSDAARCPLKRTAMVVKINAGATYTATITATYPGLAPTTFPAGTYQFVLPYSTSPDALPTSDGGHTLASPVFTING